MEEKEWWKRGGVFNRRRNQSKARGEDMIKGNRKEERSIIWE